MRGLHALTKIYEGIHNRGVRIDIEKRIYLRLLYVIFSSNLNLS
jgi:hypothetical protein